MAIKTINKERQMNILKKLRVEKGLSQPALADELGIYTSYISSLETGRNNPTIYQLIKYAKYFDVTIDYIVGNLDNFDDYKSIATDVEICNLFKNLSVEDKSKLIQIVKLIRDTLL